MRTTLIPKIYSFISETDKYALFAPLRKFSNMETINLLSESGEVIKELCSDDFVASKGFSGTDKNFLEDDNTYKLYYKTEEPVTIEYTTNNNYSPIKPAKGPIDYMKEEKERKEREELIRRYNEYVLKHGRPQN